MKNIVRITFTFFLMLVMLGFIPGLVINAQSTFTCVVKGKTFTGNVKDAALVIMNKEKVIQLNVVDGEKIMYLYIKTSTLKDLPVTLNFVDPSDTSGAVSGSEIIWVPDGPENPQWNAVEGKTLVTQFDPVKKEISGSFEFTVEKFEYTSDENQKRPSMEITNGKFTNITYKEALAQGK